MSAWSLRTAPPVLSQRAARWAYQMLIRCSAVLRSVMRGSCGEFRTSPGSSRRRARDGLTARSRARRGLRAICMTRTPCRYRRSSRQPRVCRVVGTRAICAKA
eukprot:4611948-Prymnesium_polylepis.1